MSYRWLDEITCDKCGGVFVFEKFRASTSERLFRLETVEEWLAELGWRFSDGVKRGHFCPTCSANKR